MGFAATIGKLGSYSWTRRSVPWLGALFICAIVVMAVYDIVKGYRMIVEDTGRELESQARIIAEQTARTVQAADVLMRYVADEFSGGRLSHLSKEQLRDYLNQQAVGLVQIDGLAIHDAKGDAVAMSWLPPGTAVNISGFEAFQKVRDDRNRALMVGPAARSPSDGQWVFPLLRRLETSSGNFAGAIGARGRIDYFQNFFRDVRLDPGTKITLMHRNETLLARSPRVEAAIGQHFPLLRAMVAAHEAGKPGPTRTISPVDGVELFGAVRSVPDYPLEVIVTRDVAVALAPWRQMAWGTATRTLALALLAALLLGLTQRQLMRLSAVRDKLHASRDRFALAVAGSDDGIWDWDQRGDMVFASARARELFGLPGPESQSRKEWFAALQVHPEDAQRRIEAMDAHMLGKTPHYEGEYRVRHADGTYRWIRVRGLCVRDASGQPLRMAGSVSDIDARKRTEEALRLSEERFQLAVAGVNQGVWDWDLDSDIVFLSARAQELFGYPPGDPLRARRDWLKEWTYHPDDRAQVRRAVSDYLHGITKTFEMEYRMRRLDGEWRWYRDRGIALREAQGRPYRMAGSIEDITDRKNAEAERYRLEGQLRQGQKLEAMGTLAGGIAHDFNNILAAILGYGEMAQKDAPEGTPLRRHIDAALSAGMRAKSLVERILTFSRSGMGERQPVRVESVVTEVLDAVAGSLPAGVRLVRHLAAGDAAVLSDPTQLHQVVMNLCSNAVQAIKAEGTVTVSIDRFSLDEARRVTTSELAAGRYVRLRVTDTGGGIAPEVIDRIFDPFFTTKELGVGTGLGLSLVHGIVTDLGGGIDVESTSGAGACFTVYLPWQGSMPAPSVVEAPIATGAGETILLVDDEVALVQLGEEMMAELGYEPVGFTSSTAALESFRAMPERYDVVLSDEAMPGMTGTELAGEIRKIRPDIPIVLMSGYVMPAMLARAREAGVADVLVKPLVSRDIARCLTEALHR